MSDTKIWLPGEVGGKVKSFSGSGRISAKRKRPDSQSGLSIIGLGGHSDLKWGVCPSAIPENTMAFNWRSSDQRKEVWQVCFGIIAAMGLSHNLGYWPYGRGAQIQTGAPQAMSPDMLWRIAYFVSLLLTGLFFWLGKRAGAQKEPPVEMRGAAPVVQKPALPLPALSTNRAEAVSAKKVDTAPLPQSRYLPEITVTGPEKMALMVVRLGESYMWRLKAGPAQAPQCDLICITAQVFDPEDGFVAPDNINTVFGSAPGIPALGVSGNYVFARFDAGHVWLGANRTRMRQVSSIGTERWLLRLQIPQKHWDVKLCVRWVHGTTALEFMEFQDGLPLSAY